MEVKYRNTFAEVLWFTLYQVPRSPSGQIIVGLLVLFLGYYSYNIVADLDYSFAVKVISAVVLLFVLLLIFVVFFLTLLILVQLTSQHYRSQINQDCKLIVSDSGIVDESPTKRIELKWAAIKKVSQTRNTILIYLSEQSAFLISKKAFSNESDAKSFFVYTSNLWKASKNKVSPK